MIVTCPNCRAQYRVRDEQVATDGSQLQCPECSTLFLVKPPPRDDLGAVIDKLQQENERLETKVNDLERRLAKRDADVAQAKERLARGGAQFDELVRELADAKRDLGAYPAREAQLLEELAGRDELLGRYEAQHKNRAAAEASLQAELEFLREQLARRMGSAGAPKGTSDELMALIAGLPPMLWGLQQAVDFLSPYAAKQEQLKPHVEKMRLLAALLERIVGQTS